MRHQSRSDNGFVGLTLTFKDLNDFDNNITIDKMNVVKDLKD